MNDLGSNPKLERWLLLAKDQRGPALAELIRKAMEEQGLYVYGEMLALPEVQNLASDERYAQLLSVLRLLAHGTWAEYKKALEGGLTPLSQTLQRKLKALTVVSLTNARRTLSYDDMLRALDISTLRELENLMITDCIYSGLIKGRLDQRGRCFHVEDVFARDIDPVKLGGVIETLEEWLHEAESISEHVDNKIGWMVSARENIERSKQLREQDVERRQELLRASLSTGDLFGISDKTGAATMEEDEALGDITGDDGGEDVRADLPGGSSGRVSKRRR